MDQDFDFEVISMPRSGSLWLSNFLSYGDFSICIHEPQIVDNLDLSQLSQAFVGCAGPGNIIDPCGCRTRVFIRRSLAECWESLCDFTNLVNMEQFEAWADTFARMIGPDDLVVDYDELTEEVTCGKIWEHLFGSKMPYHRWLECRRMRVTVMDTAIDEIKKVERSWR